MADKRSRSEPGAAPLPSAADDSWRARWEATQTALKERFDEPLARATAITQRTMAWFPVRVWRHFSWHNGLLLAASISYQSLFAIFAVLYVAFATVGIWLGGSSAAINQVMDLINHWIPNLISETGLVKPEQVEAVARQSGGVLAVTGAVAVVVAIWTAIGFVTFTRRAVRDIFGLPYDPRNFLLLKAHDLLAALVFGATLIIGAMLATLTSGALDVALSFIGIDRHSLWSQLGVKSLSILVAVIVNTLALAALVRFLIGADLPWRTIWRGALLGGIAVAALQVLTGVLFRYTPANPLLLSFSVLIGFLLWFRLVSIVILLSAAWIAVTAKDRRIPIVRLSETDRRAAEQRALVTAARVQLRMAEQKRTIAPWYRAWSADREVQRARATLAAAEASPPPAAVQGSLFA
ncbi:MAG: YihY/virulence factor BrkB family protein [Microbacterium sp.]|uniref:YihY/virulence factor BrkB family protein n=1 Tax=Microbacterium sp. TaxID=51671 RepID=UPI003A88A628